MDTAYATAYRECGKLQLPYWEWTNEVKERWAPVNFSATNTKYYTSFEWSNSRSTTLGIAMTGAGKNYQAGLGSLQTQTSGSGEFAEKGKNLSNQIQNWKLRFEWRKQREVCFNDGYSFYTGRNRWMPNRLVAGLAVSTDATRFTCSAANRSARIEGGLWVTRSSSSQWNGWFQIGTVKLSSSQERTTGIKLTYHLQNGKNHGYLCGNDDDPLYASFSEEVPDP